MACPKCSLQLTQSFKRPKLLITPRRAFHSTPHHQRLGAFTYAQEWTTGTYHYNKSTLKTLPTATTHTDHLLSIYATQQKRRVDRSNPLYNQITRNNITAQRRQPDRVLISKSTAKDFGDRVEVTAFVFDGAEAAEREKEARQKKRMGVKEGQQSGGQGNRRGPATRRRVGGSAAGAGGESRAGSSIAAPGGRSSGGATGARSGGAAGGGFIRRVQR